LEIKHQACSASLFVRLGKNSIGIFYPLKSKISIRRKKALREIPSSATQTAFGGTTKQHEACSALLYFSVNTSEHFE